MAKWLGKSKGVGAVLDKQKVLQRGIVNINPALTNVSAALLKWSKTESNLSLFDVFSSWSDLNYALVQISEPVIQQNFSFRQTFKNIQVEEKNLANLQQDAENACRRVRQAQAKLENAKKAKKKDKDQIKIDNCESELTLAIGSEREVLAILASKEKEFEINKAKWLKEILRAVSAAQVEYLEKSLMVWKEKLAISEAMADEPVYHAEKLNTESHRKTSSVFQSLSLDLPPRVETTEVKRSRTLPNPPPPIPAKDGDMFSGCYQSEVPDRVIDSDEDGAYTVPGEATDSFDDFGDDYMYPAGPGPPEVPPSLNNDDSGGSSDSSTGVKMDNAGLGPKVLPTLLPRSNPPKPVLTRPESVPALSLALESSQPNNQSAQLTLPPSLPPKGLSPLPPKSLPPKGPPRKSLPQGPPPQGPPPKSPPAKIPHPKSPSQPRPSPKTPPVTRGAPVTRRTPPPSPPPRQDSQETYYNSSSEDQQQSSGPPRIPDAPAAKKPAVLPKPTRPPKPTLDKTTSRESLDGNIDHEHEYSDVPIEEEDDKKGLRAAKKTNSSPLRSNNNMKQVIESDSDSESELDYEIVKDN